MPPRPSGQRPEPDRRGTGAFGNPFSGNGNFQFSFGIGGFPFGLIGMGFGNQGPNPFGFGQAQTPVRTLLIEVQFYTII